MCVTDFFTEITRIFNGKCVIMQIEIESMPENIIPNAIVAKFGNTILILSKECINANNVTLNENLLTINSNEEILSTKTTKNSFVLSDSEFTQLVHVRLYTVPET